ncbi:hypothetical protein PM082_008931 [Marasmius tenuissimus]|nr:hypothetical protein PM082_008931 [Marasmius tenuissimus]
MRSRIAWASTQSDDVRNWEEGEGAWLEFDFLNTFSSATYKTSETAKPPPRRHAPSMASQILSSRRSRWAKGWDSWLSALVWVGWKTLCKGRIEIDSNYLEGVQWQGLEVGLFWEGSLNVQSTPPRNVRRI